MKLTQLTPGRRALITSMTLSQAVVIRLEALGLRAGEEIECVRTAPLLGSLTLVKNHDHSLRL